MEYEQDIDDMDTMSNAEEMRDCDGIEDWEEGVISGYVAS